MPDLIHQYEAMLPTFLDPDGFLRPPLLALHHNDTITMACMAIPQEMIFSTAMSQFLTDLTVKELVFGIDRYTQPGQGTKYNDVFTIFWWQGERTENMGFRFGVVNYRPLPHKIIEPIDWNNAFWNIMLKKNITDYYDRDRAKERIDAVRMRNINGDVDAAIRRLTGCDTATGYDGGEDTATSHARYTMTGFDNLEDH
jgi:hypothetical protein